MHQHERRPAAALLVSHRISVHLDRLDAFRQRPSAYYCHGQRPYARRGRHSNSKLSCGLAHPLSYQPFGGRVWVKSRHCKVIGACPFYTRKRTSKSRTGMSDMGQEATSPAYSITSLAVASSVGGISIPSDLAVLRLMNRLNFVGCSKGISPGAVPSRTFFNKRATP